MLDLYLFLVELLLNPFNGIKNYVTQGQNEIRQLVEAFSDAREVFLIGDVNVGPAFPPNVTAIQPGDSFCSFLLSHTRHMTSVGT